ncbi:polysaccharide deacetylase family protein [Puniceicoccus vermicola]|uniref:Glycoside hydrolase family 57 n=1 Tax=Puniceicoccus vermicola TaxID=388746 RepID=A0A7X1E639_9BACT|nr:glycoside hydrolase family 57 [Puniceicoccus vermicola]MBC2603814.1 glycoside hydrolase family 57 [Puniceicoccus vermicola]
MKSKILFLPHGNLQYSQLDPARRPWVIDQSYAPLFDLVEKNGIKIGFEASGETLKVMAETRPKVLEQLKALMDAGQVEGVGSPFTHIMLANLPPEMGLASLKDGLDAWEKYTGHRPRLGWNPECSWADFLPEIFQEAGFDSLVMDGDSFFLSFPEIREATGLDYDVRGHSNKSKLFRIAEYIKDKPQYHRFLTNVSRTPSGLNLLFRVDFFANPMLWYLMGATEGTRDQPVALSEIQELLSFWKTKVEGSGSFIIPYAEDAEYIGTSAYFYVKQFGHARFFEHEPESVDRFEALLKTASECGFEFATPSELIEGSEVIELSKNQISTIERGSAWHGGTARAWLNTSHARVLDPVCMAVFQGVQRLKDEFEEGSEAARWVDQARREVTSAYVSDSRWPPAPTSPGRFNVQESIEDLKKANTSLEKAMQAAGIADQRSLYSPSIMRTQILSVEEELMALEYFGEKTGELSQKTSEV